VAPNDDDIAQPDRTLRSDRIKALLQDKTFDDHRIDGYQSSYIHSLRYRGRILACDD